MKTNDSLGIFWSFSDPETGEIYQDEVQGLVFYAYWSGAVPECIDIQAFLDVWCGRAEVNARRWQSVTNCNLSIDVKVNDWPAPADWTNYIYSSLKWFLNRGATLSWCGSETSSPSLDVFSSNPSGSVYAVLCEGKGFYVGSQLDEEYKDVDPDILLSCNSLLLKK